MNNFKRTAVAAAVTAAVGGFSAPASAIVIDGTFNGLFTLIDPGGVALNNSNAVSPPYYGWRTPVTGTLSFDTDTGGGTGTITPFSFAGGGLAAATAVTFQAIGNGTGGAGNLVLGNLGFNWSGNNGIPVSIVMDATGFFGAVGGGLTTGDVVSGAGALPASEGQLFGGKQSYTLPIGPVPMATTTFNTTDIGTVGLGTNPSGTLPLTDDGIGGSPMKAGPFPLWNANFDLSEVTVTSVSGGSVVPVPAAVWLFGSGLVGLVGVARRRKSA
jgi:hypothetical protein